MKSSTILCIDDERVVLNGLQSQLTRDFGEQYAIELAESGEEALEIIREILEAGHDIPIVISDQLMPGMKGNELLKNIHRVSPSTYTVLLTGQTDLEAVTDAVNHANLYRYIAKPWDGQDMIMTVREAIRGFYLDKRIEEQNRLLERHNKELEKLVTERTGELLKEKEKSEELLLNILPEETASELKMKGHATPRFYKMVTVLFTDFRAFTRSASAISPQELIETLNEAFTAFDDIVGRFNLEKIKTIGDAYMCAGGLPVQNSTNAIDAVSAALEMNAWINKWNTERKKKGLEPWEIRIGVHTGELIAGVVGKKKFAYDVWGETVNLASRMESSGETGRVNISKETYELVKGKFVCEYRGKIAVKGDQLVDMYFVNASTKGVLEKRINFGAMEKFIRAKLKNELPATLSYHGSHHTDDVYAALVHLCGLEGVGEHDGLLLRTAALYHDCGFTVSAKDHEKISCDIARETLPSFGYPDSDIEKICGMIMATKIPQSPKTKLEEILCDADLDYLGRDDYDKISSTLLDEIGRDRELSQRDWLSIQINFLKQHHFFTASSIDLRKTAKDERLRTLENKLAELK